MTSADRRGPRGGSDLSSVAAARRESRNTNGVDCSVGIMAYNEQANIGSAISSILGQQLTSGQLRELIVVASGCEDQTCEVVAEIARADPRVRLIVQERREGKASAINLFIGAARSPILIMVSADVLLKEGSLDGLLRRFEDPSVGMVGGHPIPVNSQETFLGHAVHLQWRLHDRIARRTPKLGEIVAFRNVVPSIPYDTAVDEISIQALISQLGYELVYEPSAVVYNRGPATISDFLRQRRRIYAGHLRVREQQGYSAPTMSTRRVTGALLRSGSSSTPRQALWSLGTVGLEATARLLGAYDMARHRSSHIWQISDTTKRYIVEGVNAHAHVTVAVFHIVNFHHHELEVGQHAARQLTRRARERIRQALGTHASVAAEQDGTIVALVEGDRSAAERTAQRIVEDFEAVPLPLGGHGRNADIRLACGLVAFPQSGPPFAQLIPASLLEMSGAAPLAESEVR
jgi:poly-beta-1,6-N-acetyl-D-glucosamine synthase